MLFLRSCLPFFIETGSLSDLELVKETRLASELQGSHLPLLLGLQAPTGTALFFKNMGLSCLEISLGADASMPPDLGA